MIKICEVPALPAPEIDMRARFTALTLFATALLLTQGCGTRPALSVADAAKPIGAVIEIKPPLGLPPVPVPAGNPETLQSIDLGRRLFYEKKLSTDATLACSSCHNPQLHFTDGKKHSTGVGGKLGVRNAPSVINAAYASAQFWDGRAKNLEDQAGGPIANPIEMNQTHDVCVSTLQADASYRADFAKAFGPGPITMAKVENAIASFERTLISGESPFDRYEFGSDKNALNAAAIRGLEVFRDPKRGNCESCHTISHKYALFTDGRFHNIGIGVDDDGNLSDLGRYTETKADSDKGAFKTPSLRNVAESPPYMHDGSLKTLKDVVDFYAGHGNSNPYLDKQIQSITLSGRDRADLVAFLESLTGQMPPNVGPPETARLKTFK